MFFLSNILTTLVNYFPTIHLPIYCTTLGINFIWWLSPNIIGHTILDDISQSLLFLWEIVERSVKKRLVNRWPSQQYIQGKKKCLFIKGVNKDIYRYNKLNKIQKITPPSFSALNKYPLLMLHKYENKVRFTGETPRDKLHFQWKTKKRHFIKAMSPYRACHCFLSVDTTFAKSSTLISRSNFICCKWYAIAIHKW